MSVARDISRQTSRQTVTLTANQTAVTVTGGFNGASIEAYLNGARLIQGSDYSLNGTSGITLTQGASAGDIIEFSVRNTSSSGLSAVNTSEIIDEAVTFDKLSNSATEADNLQKRVASAWVNFAGGGGDGSTITAASSFGVSSIADNGVGDYTVNFETAFSDANYVWAGCAGDTNTTSASANSPFSIRSAVVSSGSLRFRVCYANATNYGFLDRGEVTLIFFGD